MRHGLVLDVVFDFDSLRPFLLVQGQPRLQGRDLKLVDPLFVFLLALDSTLVVLSGQFRFRRQISFIGLQGPGFLTFPAITTGPRTGSGFIARGALA